MTKMHTTGRLNLIDLAGSGSGSSAGNRFKETPCVNQSLLALENVIYALWNKQTDVRLKKSALAALLHDLFCKRTYSICTIRIEYRMDVCLDRPFGQF